MDQPEHYADYPQFTLFDFGYNQWDRLRDWLLLGVAVAVLVLAIVILVHVVREKEAMEDGATSMHKLAAMLQQLAAQLLSQSTGSNATSVDSNAMPMER